MTYVVSCPDIPEAPASPCNIIHYEPITGESKLYLESPLAECDIDYLLKNQKAEVYRMRSPGQKGYRLPASPFTACPSAEQRESRLFSSSRQPSSRKLKFSYSIGRSACGERKSRHDMAGFATAGVWLPPVAGRCCDVIAGTRYNKTAH